ncbi:MAG: DHA2 family efflux MFS transporter permease subunit [Candidatus Dormibacteraeota bacterium]|nr:DHA2 family efflux MFS transporter permease subunit [Candidatus Dormibacteraeota bacterium]
MSAIPTARDQRSRPGWTLALTSVAFFMTALDTLVVITALPAIHRELGGSVSTLEWTVNAYLLAFAAGIIPAAALGDRLGRRRVYTLGLALFTAGSAACALAPSPAVLIAARAIQGLGAAVVTPLSLTLLTAAFRPQRRGAIVGIWGGIAGLAVAGGPLVGGAVTEGLDWHWIFWVNVPIGVAAAALSMVRLTESRGPATHLDLPGVALVAAGTGALAWGLVRAADAGFGSAQVASALGLGAFLLAGFVAWELRSDAPMLPPRLFRLPGFAAANAVGFLMTASLMAAAFLASEYFQLGLGFSPLGTGLRFLPWTATALLVAPAAGALADRIGPRPVMLAGMLVQGVGLAWFAAAAGVDSGYGSLVIALVVAGVGVSMVLPAAPTAALGAVPPADMGKASGAISTVQRLGGAFGIAVTTAVFTANGHLGSPEAVTAGFKPALAVCAGASMLGALAALLVGSRRGATATATPAEVWEAAASG